MMDRRNALALIGGTAASLFVANPGVAATVTRRFDILRGKKRIGGQTLRVSRNGSKLSVAVDVDIKVRILGLPAYSYQLSSREAWQDGMLMTLNAKTNDNGTRDFVEARRSGKSLAIKGSAYSGKVGGNPATTTYWATGMLPRTVWINTQNGQPMNIRARQAGAVSFPTPQGTVKARKWDLSGDLSDLDLFYDSANEWIGNQFVARGETVRFVVAQRGGNLAPLWFAGA